MEEDVRVEAFFILQCKMSLPHHETS